MFWGGFLGSLGGILGASSGVFGEVLGRFLEIKTRMAKNLDKPITITYQNLIGLGELGDVFERFGGYFGGIFGGIWGSIGEVFRGKQLIKNQCKTKKQHIKINFFLFIIYFF